MDVWGAYTPWKWRRSFCLGEQIDGRKVYWDGGWGRDRLFFYVMVARAEELNPKPAFTES